MGSVRAVCAAMGMGVAVPSCSDTGKNHRGPTGEPGQMLKKPRKNDGKIGGETDRHHETYNLRSVMIFLTKLCMSM